MTGDSKKSNSFGDLILDLVLIEFPDLTKKSKETFLKKLIRLYLETEKEKVEKIVELTTGMVLEKAVV